MLFSQKLKNSLEDLHLLKHPFYQDWMDGKLTRAQLKKYAEQYYTHVEAFPRYISATHSNCTDVQARKMLLENLNDEEGFTQTPHPQLWINFATGLGADCKEVEQGPKIKSINSVVSTFMEKSKSSYAEGLAGLYAYEYQVPEVADSKIEGLKARYDISDEKTLEFFEVHKTADVYHRKACEEFLDQLSEVEQEKALSSARECGQALWDFLSEVHELDTQAA